MKVFSGAVTTFDTDRLVGSRQFPEQDPSRSGRSIPGCCSTTIPMNPQCERLAVRISTPSVHKCQCTSGPSGRVSIFQLFNVTHKTAIAVQNPSHSPLCSPAAYWRSASGSRASPTRISSSQRNRARLKWKTSWRGQPTQPRGRSSRRTCSTTVRGPCRRTFWTSMYGPVGHRRLNRADLLRIDGPGENWPGCSSIQAAEPDADVGDLVCGSPKRQKAGSFTELVFPPNHLVCDTRPALGYELCSQKSFLFTKKAHPSNETPFFWTISSTFVFFNIFPDISPHSDAVLNAKTRDG